MWPGSPPSRFRLRDSFPYPFIDYRAWHLNPLRGWLSSLRPSIAPTSWYRNINRLSITYAFRPRLRPD